MSSNNKICPSCKEIHQEQCDPLCREVHSTNCIIHEGAISCLGIEEGVETPLSEILPLLCGINGGNLSVQEIESEDCPNGGTTVTIGLDDGEFTPLITFDVCNGEDGTDGTTPDVELLPEPPGANCSDGGVKLTVNGTVTYICNGQDGADGQDGEDGVTPFLDLDFSCLEGLGVDIGDDITENFQALINTVCYVLEGNPTPPTAPIAANLEFEVCEGETIGINLLQGSILDSPATAVNFTPTNPADGYVIYNPMAPPATGLLDITGDSLGTEVRTYEIVTAGGTSNEATVTINVVECEELTLAQQFFGCSGGGTELIINRDGNTLIGWDIPLNPSNVYDNFFVRIDSYINCTGAAGTHLLSTTLQINPAGLVSAIIPNTPGSSFPLTIPAQPSIAYGLGKYGPSQCSPEAIDSLGSLTISFFGDVTINGNPVSISDGDPDFTFAIPGTSNTTSVDTIISPACI